MYLSSDRHCPKFQANNGIWSWHLLQNIKAYDEATIKQKACMCTIHAGCRLTSSQLISLPHSSSPGGWVPVQSTIRSSDPRYKLPGKLQAHQGVSIIPSLNAAALLQMVLFFVHQSPTFYASFSSLPMPAARALTMF